MRQLDTQLAVAFALAASGMVSCVEAPLDRFAPPPIQHGEDVITPGCTARLDHGSADSPLVLGPDGPCFDIVGEDARPIFAEEGGLLYYAARTFESRCVPDEVGSNYGEASAYGKWVFELADSAAGHYALDAWLRPHSLPVARWAKYKVWADEVGACFSTIGQDVDVPRWVPVGVFRFIWGAVGIRLTNATGEAAAERDVLFDRIRLRHVPACDARDPGRTFVVTSPACEGSLCSRLEVVGLTLTVSVTDASGAFPTPPFVELVDVEDDGRLEPMVPYQCQDFRHSAGEVALQFDLAGWRGSRRVQVRAVGVCGQEGAERRGPVQEVTRCTVACPTTGPGEVTFLPACQVPPDP